MENNEDQNMEVVKQETPEPSDLQLNFSGDNRTSTLFISYKDCHKVAYVLKDILTDHGIKCNVVDTETTPNTENV